MREELGYYYHHEEMLALFQFLHARGELRNIHWWLPQGSPSIFF